MSGRATTAVRRDADQLPPTAVPVGFLGSGLHLPPDRVTNADLVRTLDTSDAWIRERLGISERRFLAAGLSTSDMCVEAARAALADAQLDAADVDAILLATVTPDQPLPSTAIVVAQKIGALRAIPIDLTQAACAGGVIGLIIAAQLLQNPAIRHVLLIGGDAMSRLTDPAERTSRVIFGDAAGAVVLGRVPAGYGLLGWDVGMELSYGVTVPAGGAARPAGFGTVAAGEHYLHMDGPATFRAATEQLPRSIRAASRRAGVPVEEIRYFALHQANGRIIDQVLADLGVPAERAGRTLATLGNTASASMFTVLHDAFVRGAVGRGVVIAVSGIGAGLVWGALCLRLY